MRVKYFGFSSLQQSTVRAFFNCSGDEVYTAGQLQTQCQQLNSSANEYTQLTQLQPDNSIADGDRFAREFPLYVAAGRDAHILLASNSTYDTIQSGYQIGRLISISSLRHKYVHIYIG